MAELNHSALYEHFVKPLEAQHQGEFVAVNADGQTIVDKDDIKVVDQALKQFGPGMFVLLKVGSKGVGKWRRRQGL
jgi:molybdopterin-guanine dinucleotide biosynthesis protein A